MSYRNPNDNVVTLYNPEPVDDYEDTHELDEGGALLYEANDMIASNQHGLAHVLSAEIVGSVDLHPKGFLERMDARGHLRFVKDASAAVRQVTTDMRVAQNELNATVKDLVDTRSYVYEKFRTNDIDRALHPYKKALAISGAKEQLLASSIRMANQRTISAQRRTTRHLAERAEVQERPESRPMTNDERIARQAVIRGKNGTATFGPNDLYSAFAALTYSRYYEESRDAESAADQTYQDVLFMVQTKGISEADARAYASEFEREKRRMDANKMSKAQGENFAAQFRDARSKR